MIRALRVKKSYIRCSIIVSTLDLVLVASQLVEYDCWISMFPGESNKVPCELTKVSGTERQS